MAAATTMEANEDDEIVRQSDAEVEADDAKKYGAEADANTMNDDSYESGSGSESESEEEEEDFEDAHSEDNEDDEAMPDGDSNADLHALLAFSKSRLEKKTQPEPTPVEEEEDDKNDGSDDDEQSIHEEAEEEEIPFESTHSEESPSTTTESETIPAESAIAEEESPSTNEESPDLNKGVSEDSQDLLEIAKKKLAEAEAKASADDDEADPAHLLKLAEKKVKEAEEKAKMDEEATGNVLKPAVSTTRRSDANSELWALLNYSKMRIETGSTPQLGKKGTTTPTQRDDVSVNSKLSKSSKRSLNSKKSIASKISTSSGQKAVTVTVEGLPPRSPEADAPVSNVANNDADAPVPNVTSGDASVDGSVSMANSVEEDEESRSSRSDDEDDSSDEEDEEGEEDELPSFLKDDEDDVDPEEARKLYEEAKFKAASILSVSEEKLTDVQMLQAIAIAEEAARTGEEKFSTKRSLFKLSEAKLEDLKSFLDFGENKEEAASSPSNTSAEKEPVGWGIGRGRFVKKVGSLFSDFKEKCEELDERKKSERVGKPSNSEILDAAMIDIKKQIDEFESIVRKKAGS
mmetsp:Transcript_11617/g.23283  ORF Transcript_11617/g.23283 Transcript_11617/m.23283 type:complete len:576 (+) Transcript_11617:63-1790(+)